MKFWVTLSAFIGLLSLQGKAQSIITTGMTISVPPAPAGEILPVQTSMNSFEYDAQVSVQLLPGFDATGNSSNYFLAMIVPPVSYYDLKTKLDASYGATDAGSLYFKYNEKYSEGNLNYTIYDYQRNVMLSGSSLVVNKTMGGNFITLNLSTVLNSTSTKQFVGTSELDSYYTLEVTNDKGDKFYLRFKYLTSSNYH